MLRKAHLCVGVGLASIFTLDPAVLLLAGLASLIPDLDRPFGHRGWFSHSLFAAFIFAIVTAVASGFNLLFAFVVFLAVSAHAILDLFSKSGVPLLYPYREYPYRLNISSSTNSFVNGGFAFAGIILLAFSVNAAVIGA